MSGQDEQPTLRTVADAAGVSIATASHAFNRPDRVGPATRERVLAAARALNYSGPNPAARALRRQNVGSLTLTVARNMAEFWTRPAAVRFCAGVAATCDRVGVTMNILRPGELLGGPTVAFRPDPDQVLPGAQIVVVDTADIDRPSITADTDTACRQLVDELAQLGHRGLAIVGWAGETARRDQLIAAWGDRGPLKVVNARGLGRGDGEAAVLAALADGSDITAIAAVADELALGAIDGVHRLGRRVPVDMSVVGIDDIPEAQFRGLTTAFVPYGPMGEMAAEFVLNGGPLPPAFPVPIALRHSMAAARPS